MNERHAGRIRNVDLAVVALFAFFVALHQPRIVVPFGDAFGFLDAAVSTTASGGPVRSHWLAPMAVSLSLISAAIWRLTDSFYLATQGFMGVSVVVFFASVRALFTARLGRIGATALAFGLSTLPGFWNESLFFQGKTLSLALLVLALNCAERSAWSWFWLIVGVAVANRESALVWALFPWWRRGVEGNGPSLRNLILGTFGIVAVAFGLKFNLPVTFADQVVLDELKTHLTLGGCVHRFFCLFSLFPLLALLLSWLEGKRTCWREGWSWKIILLCTMAAGWIQAYGQIERCVLFSPMLWTLSMVAIPLLPASARVGGAGRAVALALCGVYTLRDQLWPTYWFEPMIFFLADTSPVKSDTFSEGLRRCGGLLLGCLVVCNLRYVADWDRQQQQRVEALVKNEHLVRSGQPVVLDFGHAGWRHFFLYAALPESRPTGLLGWMEQSPTSGADFPLNEAEWTAERLRRQSVLRKIPPQKR